MTSQTDQTSTADLLQQYGTACAEVATEQDDRKAVDPFDRAMELKRQILARASVTPQRATTRLGDSMWLHPCGRVIAGESPSCDCCSTPGGWQALYTLAVEES